MNGKHATPAVDQRRGQRCRQQQRDEKHPRVNPLRYGDVTHPAGFSAKVATLVSRATKELHKERTRHIEALHHDRVHFGGQVIALAHDALQPSPKKARGDSENRQKHQGYQREFPREHEHDDQDQGDADEIADHGLKDVGERLLGSDNVIVQAADQSPSLSAGEEGERHALHVGKDFDPHIIDQALTHLRRYEALPKRESGVQKSKAGHHEGKSHDEAGAMPQIFPG